MYTAVTLNRYGSLEIKRAYRKNMALGIIGAAIIMICAVSAYRLSTNISAENTSIESAPPRDSVVIIDFPIPRIDDTPRPIHESPDKPLPTAGIPTPVPDADAPENATIPSQTELIELINRSRLNDSTFFKNVVLTIEDTEQLIPKPGTFISYDEPPRVVESVAPIYPEMARLAGLRGEVWIQAYIDKNGNVKAVEILKPSGANAGFEEAAIAAAQATSWTPAISNGQPVGVWVSYKIEFRLK